MRREMLISFDDIFPSSEKPNIVDLLGGISKDNLIKVATIFLSSGKKSLKNFLETYMGKDNQDFANSVYTDFVRKEHVGNVDEYVVLNTISSLRFYEVINSSCTEHATTKLDSEIMVDIFKAYLLCNQEFTDLDNKISLTIKDNFDDLKVAKMMLTAVIRYHTIDNVALIREMYMQTYKAILLFKFLENNCDILLNTFLETARCVDWREYIHCFYGLFYPVLKSKQLNSPIEIKLKSTDEYEKQRNFLKMLSHVTIDEDIDFRPLRSQPLYESEEGVFVPILPIFVIEQLYKGLYFRLKSINNTLKEPIKELKSFIGEYFSEKVLFVSIIREILGNKYLQRTDQEMTEIYGAVGTPDFYLRNGKKVFLFEVKDTLLKADSIASCDYSMIEKDLKNKLYENNQNKNKPKPKGVLQLVEDVNNILDKGVSWDINLKRKNVIVHPILVLTDNILIVLDSII